MISRIRKAMDEKDQGFTLIELLVVMIIIGILAAIAIPIFLNQRKSAVDASIKSDLRTIATSMETVFVDTQAYPGVAQGGAGQDVVLTDANSDVTNVSVSEGNVFAPSASAAAGTFCIEGSNTNGTGKPWAYDSDAGGLIEGSC